MTLRVLTDETKACLDNAAKDLAAKFLLDQGREVKVLHKDGTESIVTRDTRDWIMQEFYNFWYKDEFEYLVEQMRDLLGGSALADFNARVAQLEPRSDEVFKALLEEKRPAGYEPAPTE